MLTTSELWDESVIVLLRATTDKFGSSMVAGLFTNIIDPSKTLVVADLIEPTYAGYAQQAVVMNPPSRDPVTGIVSQSGSLLWKMDDAVIPTTIRGIFYGSGSGPVKLIGMENFNPAIPLVDEFDAFQTVLEYIESSENPGSTTVIR